MRQLLYLCVLLSCFLACNKYEITHTNSILHITVVDQQTQEPLANQAITLRTSNFSNIINSECYYEDSTTVRTFTGVSDINGDISFDIPFIDGLPQRYYEMSLTRSNRSIRRSSFIKEYVQTDRFEIGDYIPVEVIVTQDSSSLISLVTCGFRSKEDRKKAREGSTSIPHDVTRIGFAYGPVDTISALIPYDQNRVFSLLVVDRNSDTPILLSSIPITPEKDSTVFQSIKIR